MAVTLYWTAIALTQDSLQVGYSILAPAADGGVPVAIALFRLGDDSGTLISEAGVEAVRPIRSGRVLVNQADALTGLALVNLGTKPVTVHFLLRNFAGAVEASRDLTFEPGRHRALFVNPDLFPEIDSDFFGTLTFSSDSPDASLVAVTIRQASNGRREPLFSTLPVAALETNGGIPAGGGASLIFPHVGAGLGLSTQIALLNRANVRVSGMIRFRQSDGTPLSAVFNGIEGSEFPFEMPPDGAFLGSLTSLSGVTQGFASVETNSGSAPAGTAIFQFRDVGGALVSEAGVAASVASRHFRLFVDSIGTQTGVAFANPNDSEAQLDAQLLDRYGFPLRAAQIRVPAQGHTACFAAEIFGPLPANFSGLMDVRSDSEVVPISLKLTQNSRGDSILTTLPVADLSIPRPVETLVFPQIGFGTSGRYRFSTQLILLSASLDSEVAGTLSFYGEEGESLDLPLAGEDGSEFPVQLAPGSARRLRPGNNAGVSRIEITSQSLGEIPVNVGETVPLAVAVVDDQGTPRDDFELSFTSLDPVVAAIDDGGHVTGDSPGFSTLSVSAGGVLASATLTVVEVLSGGDGYGITGVARDLSRRLFLADSLDHTVLRVDSLQEVPDLYAGVPGSAGLRDEERLASLFDEPAFLALNQASGVLYVSDTQNHAIRLAEPGPHGRVDTMTGGIGPGYRDGSLVEAQFNQPEGLAFDPKGNLWVADRGNHVIRRISLTTGMVETVAGLPGVAGFLDGQGDEARFDSPIGLALEPEPLGEQLARAAQGGPPPPVRVIVADSGNGAVRRVDENGVVESIPVTAPAGGTGPSGFVSRLSPFGVAVDGSGNIYVSDPEAGTVRILLHSGGAVDLAQPGTFTQPRGMALTDSGRLVVADGGRFGTEARFGVPEISQLSPDRVGVQNGQTVTIQGRNFSREVVVVVASQVLDDVQRVDTGTLQVVLPSLPSGLTNLTVQTRGGLAQAALLVEPVPLEELPIGAITTVAGGSTFSGDGGPALEAAVAPVGITLDAQGGVLVLDSSRNSLRRIDPNGSVILSLAGNGVPGSGGDGGLASAASLFPVFPGSSGFLIGAAVDASGNIFLSDHGRIRRIDASSGIIDTAAGGAFGFCGDGGPALDACFDNPNGLAFDGSGNLYLADTGNNRVRRIDADTGIVTTVAGNGSSVDSGDGGPAADAGLETPVNVAVDASGSLYVSTRTRVRRVGPDGTITTFAGNGESAGADVGDGGPAVEAEISPFGLAVDDTGAVFVADQDHHRIRRVDPSGLITTIAGTGEAGFSGDGGAASEAELSSPTGLVLDGSGNVFFCDLFNYRVRRIDATTGLIFTLAGNGDPRFDDDGLPLTASSLLFPTGIAFDAEGRLHIADTTNDRIRRAELDGTIRTIAGNRPAQFSGDGGPALEADLYAPRGLGFDQLDNLFFADSGNNRIRRIGVDGIIDTVAGASNPAYVPGFAGDGGPAAQALLDQPRGVVVDGQGNLFVSDTGNNRVRLVSGSNGTIQTLVGEGGLLPQPLSHPEVSVVTSAGSLLIADTENNRVLRLDGPVLTRAAGGLAVNFCDQSNRAQEISLLFPQGLAADTAGRFYIADTLNHRVLRVDTDASVTTVAGTCEPKFSGDGGPAASASLSNPTGLALDADGNLYIADTDNHRIRAIRLAPPP